MYLCIMQRTADITSRKDIEKLVNTFYDRVIQDAVIGPFFQHLDFDKHLPKMVDFWEFVLLDAAGYSTDVTKMHMHMRLKKEHFDQWIALFNTTVDELFVGEKASKAKERAFLIRWTIESKMNA